MLNFVTSQSLENTSGGWSGLSANTFEQLNKRFPTTYVGPIAPPIPPISKAISKGMRLLGQQGSFPFYGPTRLARIRNEWSNRRNKAAKFDMFHAATDWVSCQPEVPYGAYIDPTFRMYMEV